MKYALKLLRSYNLQLSERSKTKQKNKYRMARKMSYKKNLGLAKPVQKCVNRTKSNQKSKPKPKLSQSKRAQNIIKPLPKAQTVVKPRNQTTSGKQKTKKSNSEPTLTNKSKVIKTKTKPRSQTKPEATKITKPKQKDPRSSVSPSLFASHVIDVYKELKYPITQTIIDPDLTKINSSDELTSAIKGIVIGNAEMSPDLFESDLNSEEHIIVKETISVGTQCSPVTLPRITQDVAVNTEPCISIDIGVQTDPIDMSRLFEWHGLGNVEFIETEVSDASSDSDSTSLNQCWEDFDMLENLRMNKSNTINPHGNRRLHSKKNDYNKYKCVNNDETIIASPPRNQVYKNRSFHSPDSLKKQQTTSKSK